MYHKVGIDSPWLMFSWVVAWGSDRSIFVCFVLVWEAQWSSAYATGDVWEVERMTASVGLRPELSLGNRSRIGVQQGETSEPCHYSNRIAAIGSTICFNIGALPVLLGL